MTATVDRRFPQSHSPADPVGLIDVISERDFLAGAAEFLTAHAPPRPSRSLGWGVGSDEIPVMDAPTAEQERIDLEAARRWRTLLCDAGYGWVDGPPAHGGAGLPSAYARAFARLQRGFETPRLDSLLVSLRIVLPAIAAHGSDVQKAAFLRPLLRGDLIACQLFSESEAGSDLAGVRTRAEADGDGWVVRGHKVWTSGAHYSHLGLLLARTDPERSKHAGLTMFLVDLQAPGVAMRPLRQMTGAAPFNEVFLDGLSVPDSRRIGDLNGGWAVTLTTLGGERQAVGDSEEAPITEVTRRLTELARRQRSNGQPLTGAERDAVTAAHVLGWVAERTNERLAAAAERRGSAGPEMSIAKLLRNRVLRRAIDTAGTVLGPAMVADTGAWGTFAWGRAAVTAPGLRLGGGTDEIQHNILAERVLGLPRDHR